MARTSTSSLLHAVAQAEPLAVVIYPDSGERAHLIDEIIDLRGGEWRYIREPAELFESDDRPTFLVPVDEGACVRLLERRRETLVDREGPIVLFLLRGGTGQDALREAPALKSWVLGNEVDPIALEDLDLDAARGAFQRLTGQTAAEWLGKWRAGEVPETTEAHALAHRALLIEGE